MRNDPTPRQKQKQARNKQALPRLQPLVQAPHRTVTPAASPHTASRPLPPLHTWKNKLPALLTSMAALSASFMRSASRAVGAGKRRVREFKGHMLALVAVKRVPFSPHCEMQQEVAAAEGQAQCCQRMWVWDGQGRE
jgi:hypothetical protein